MKTLFTIFTIFFSFSFSFSQNTEDFTFFVTNGGIEIYSYTDQKIKVAVKEHDEPMQILSGGYNAPKGTTQKFALEEGHYVIIIISSSGKKTRKEIIIEKDIRSFNDLPREN